MLYSCSYPTAGAHPWGLVPNFSACHLPLREYFLFMFQIKSYLSPSSPNEFSNTNVLSAEFLSLTVLYIFLSPGYCSLLCNKPGLPQWENSQPYLIHSSSLFAWEAIEKYTGNCSHSLYLFYYSDKCESLISS